LGRMMKQSQGGGWLEHPLPLLHKCREGSLEPVSEIQTRDSRLIEEAVE